MKLNLIYNSKTESAIPVEKKIVISTNNLNHSIPNNTIHFQYI